MQTPNATGIFYRSVLKYSRTTVMTSTIYQGRNNETHRPILDYRSPNWFDRSWLWRRASGLSNSSGAHADDDQDLAHRHIGATATDANTSTTHTDTGPHGHAGPHAHAGPHKHTSADSDDQSW